MIPRAMEKKLKLLAMQFPVVALLGPRQAGKTTLAQIAFPGYKYVSLEDLNQRAYAAEDPVAFLENYSNGEGVIIDEVQHTPALLSYIQTIVDKTQLPGKFILTGSQNFILNERISQTLAGRIAILTLWPLSIDELKKADMLPAKYESLIFKGGYPRIYAQHITPTDWYPNYIKTYIEKDVRQVKNVTDLMTFQRFLKLCAGRIGQIVSWSDLGRDCGINYNTAKAWISLLEASYIVFLLSPHHQNFNKRVIKSPKLYFCDTGVACSLLGIESEKQLESHYLRGPLMESLMISDFIKSRLDKGMNSNCYYWRDQAGHEIDCIIEEGDKLKAVEIKSSKAISQDDFANLTYWSQLAQNPSTNAYVVYGGDEEQKRSQGKVVAWENASETILNLD